MEDDEAAGQAAQGTGAPAGTAAGGTQGEATQVDVAADAEVDAALGGGGSAEAATAITAGSTTSPEANGTGGAEDAVSAGGTQGADAAGSEDQELPKTTHEKQEAARAFAERWKDAGEREIADTQTFWGELLRTVFGVKDLKSIIQFEKPVYVDGHKKSIDGFITLKSLAGTSRILIEQKKRTVDMAREGRQSGGAMLSPYQQAKRYADNLPLNEKPRWIVTCNFATFAVYDMKLKRPEQSPEVVRLADLGAELYRLEFLADAGKEVAKRQEAASKQTGSLIGQLYDMLLSKALEPTTFRRTQQPFHCVAG